VKTYTIVYMVAHKRPRVTWQMEMQAPSPEAAITTFVNSPGMGQMFVACVVEGPSASVYFTA